MMRSTLVRISGFSLLLIYFVFLNPHIDMRGFGSHDPAIYLNRALAIWNGFGFGEKFADAFLPVTIQTPGFPVLLALLVGLFGIHFTVLKIFMVCLALWLSWVAYHFFVHFLHHKQDAGWATLLLMSSPVVFGLSHRAFAEIPMMGFLFMGIVFLQRALESKAVVSWDLILAALFISAAFFFKTMAVVVLTGPWLMTVHPQYRSWRFLLKVLIFSLLVFLPVFAWFRWTQSIPEMGYWSWSQVQFFTAKNFNDMSSPFASAGDWITRMRENFIWGIAANIGVGFVPLFYLFHEDRLGFFLGIPFVLGLCMLGFRFYRERPTVLEGFLLAGIGLLLVIILGLAIRYMVIFYPVFILYALNFLEKDSWLKKFKHAWVAVFFLMGFGVSLYAGVDQWKNPYGTVLVWDYVDIAMKAKGLIAPDKIGRVPLASHWQILTGHSCTVSKRSPADYYVILSEGAPKDILQYKDLEGDLMKGGFEITRFLADKKKSVRPLYQNSTYSLVAETA